MQLYAPPPLPPRAVADGTISRSVAVRAWRGYMLARMSATHRSGLGSATPHTPTPPCHHSAIPRFQACGKEACLLRHSCRIHLARAGMAWYAWRVLVLHHHYRPPAVATAGRTFRWRCLLLPAHFYRRLRTRSNGCLLQQNGQASACTRGRCALPPPRFGYSLVCGSHYPPSPPICAA